MIHLSYLEEKGTEPSLTKKGESTRRKLLEAAEEIFGKKGYYDTSVVEITQKAGVAQGTFYKYFSSKKEIFDCLVSELSRSFRSEIRMATKDATSVKEAHRKGFATFFRWVKEHPNLYSIVQQSVLVDPQLYRGYYERIAEGYVRGLSEGMKRGEIKKGDPEVMAYLLMGAAQLMGMRWVVWEEQEIPERVIDEAVSDLFEGILDKKRDGI